MANRRRFITQASGFAFAAIAIASVSIPRNAASAAKPDHQLDFIASGAGGIGSNMDATSLQANKTGNELIHHHYP